MESARTLRPGLGPRTSPKAVNRVAKYGSEGAMRMARETLPLGIVVAVVLFAIGAWGLCKAMLPAARHGPRRRACPRERVSSGR